VVSRGYLDETLTPPRTAGGFEVDAAAVVALVQAVTAVAETVVRSLVGPFDESVWGRGHVKNGRGNDVSFLELRYPTTKWL
jgi:hypothetical protein